MSDFNLNIWNTNAEAELAAEYQRIATHNPAENTRVFHCGLSSGSTSQSFVSRSSTTFGSRFLRLISFTIANTIHCELPIVLVANDRMGAVRVMIGKVLTSISVDLSTVCIVEIEQALLGQCEQIAAKCTASDGERQAARNIETSANNIASIFVTLATNAFTSLWLYITTGLTPTQSFLQTEAIPETCSYNFASFDGIIHTCATIVAQIVVSRCNITPPDKSTGPRVPFDVIESIIFIALHIVARWIMRQKDERGGWVPWLGSALRGLIVEDERQRHWTGPSFDTIEGQITRELICPLTVSLVVDPVVGPYGRIYERERLYLHLQIFGCDPVSNEPASALSYTRSPVAARLAKEIARRNGARLEPL